MESPACEVDGFERCMIGCVSCVRFNCLRLGKMRVGYERAWRRTDERMSR